MSIKIENTQIFGWEGAIRGARNPMNSWEKSDAIWINSAYGTYETILGYRGDFEYEEDKDDEDMANYYGVDDFVLEGMYIGPADRKLLMNLCKGGTEEAKWRRMVHVQMDITAPLYWWKEFETYKVGTTSNSCSTMHKIHSKEFTLDDFSCEHLGFYDLEKTTDDQEYLETAFDMEIGDEGGPYYPIDALTDVVDSLNHNRDKFLETGNKKYWWQMIQLLPTSYNQRRTIDLNYEVLASQYRQRKEHRLDEWREYCEWIKTLPYSEFIMMEKTND